MWEGRTKICNEAEADAAEQQVRRDHEQQQRATSGREAGLLMHAAMQGKSGAEPSEQLCGSSSCSRRPPFPAASLCPDPRLPCSAHLSFLQLGQPGRHGAGEQKAIQQMSGGANVLRESAATGREEPSWAELG